MTTDWFKKEKKKEKMKLLKSSNKKVDMKLPKNMKDILLLTGGTILVAKAIDMID